MTETYLGFPIHMAPMLRDGAVVMTRNGIFIGVGEWTDEDRNRELARRIVRNGLADVLEWLGEKVGPAVDAPMPAFTGHEVLEQIEREAEHA